MLHIKEEEILALRRKVLEKEFARMNERQREAVFETEGPLLILAGAGSGKTTVVVHRIANLIRYGKAYRSDWISPELTEGDLSSMKAYLSGVPLPEVTKKHMSVSPCPPWKIMAITFTNKAAGELKERLCGLLGEEGQSIWASTFHASCAKILRKDGDKIGYTSHFTIYDTEDSRRLMKDCLKQMNISEKEMPIKSVLGEISRAKDSLTSVKELEERAGNDFRMQLVARAYALYQARLRDANAMDFDDLIVNTVRLFRTHPEVLAYYQDRFRYLMVDEYQDTNHAQYELVRLLAEKSRNLCVVGDDDQSIYKFRGATIENIMSFEQSFSGAKVIRLEQNYRSTQNILDAANQVIAHNTARKGKNLWTDNGSGKTINLHLAENEQDEANKIGQEILRMVEKGRKFSDIAILYRMNSQSLAFERMFAKQGIPHRILGGLRFYERAEIKDMLSYLSVIDNPEDEVRLRRIINCPRRGIGDKTVETVSEIGQQIGESMFTVLSHCEDFPALSKSAKKLGEFYELIRGLAEMLEEGSSLTELYTALLEKTEYEEYLKVSEPEKAEEKAENVAELLSNIRRYEEEGGTLADFLEEIALITDIDNYDGTADSVVLMTIHSAKGLEFPVVFLPGWEENIFPGMSTIYYPEEVEEERRLAYVAITRAKEELYIYHTESRMIFGSTTRNKLSRFAEEIPKQLLEETRSRPAFTSFQRMSQSGDSQREGRGYGGASYSGTVSSFGFQKPKKTPPAVPQGSYQVGDTVGHRTFGQGVILTVTPMGNDTLLEIAFEKVGTKKLFANYAKLQKI